MEDYGSKASVEPLSPTRRISTFEIILTYLNLTPRIYNQIERIMEKMIKTVEQSGGTSADLVVLFASKHYVNDPNPESEAKSFLEVLYGSIDYLFRAGPKKALQYQLSIHRTKDPKGILRAFSSSISATGYSTGTSSGSPSSSMPPPSRTRAVATSMSSDDPHWRFAVGKYKIGPVLGKGGTATVRLGLDTDANELVAVKILEPEKKATAEAEVKIMRELDHPNVLRVRDVFKNVSVGSGIHTDVFMLDFAEHGEFIDYLIWTQHLEENLARWFFKCAVGAIEHNFSRGVIHRDIKHDNMLLSNGFRLLLADYGFATHWNSGDEPLQKALGTLCYAAPEMMAKEGYSQAADIYSLGVMLFVAVVGRQPFKNATPNDKLYKLVIKRNWKKFWSAFSKTKISDECKELLQGMLERNPAKRMTIKQIKETIWYNDESLTQEQAAEALRKRKELMNKKKRAKGSKVFAESAAKMIAATHRGAGDDTDACPLFHWLPKPDILFGFYTDEVAAVVQDQLKNTFTQLKAIVKQPKYATAVVEEAGELLDLSKKGREEMKAAGDGGFGGLLDDDVVHLADGTPNPYKADFELVVNGQKVEGSWEIYTEQLTPEEQADVDSRIAKTRELNKAVAEYEHKQLESLLQTRKLKEMLDTEDDTVSIADMEKAARLASKKAVDEKSNEAARAAAKKAASEFLAKQLGDEEKEFNSETFYTEGDRKRLGKRNIVVIKPKRSKVKRTLEEASKMDTKNNATLKWFANKGAFVQSYSRILEMNWGLVAS